MTSSQVAPHFRPVSTIDWPISSRTMIRTSLTRSWSCHTSTNVESTWIGGIKASSSTLFTNTRARTLSFVSVLTMISCMFTPRREFSKRGSNTLRLKKNTESQRAFQRMASRYFLRKVRPASILLWSIWTPTDWESSRISTTLRE